MRKKFVNWKDANGRVIRRGAIEVPMDASRYSTQVSFLQQNVPEKYRPFIVEEWLPFVGTFVEDTDADPRVSIKDVPREDILKKLGIKTLVG